MYFGIKSWYIELDGILLSAGCYLIPPLQPPPTITDKRKQLKCRKTKTKTKTSLPTAIHFDISGVEIGWRLQSILGVGINMWPKIIALLLPLLFTSVNLRLPPMRLAIEAFSLSLSLYGSIDQYRKWTTTFLYGDIYALRLLLRVKLRIEYFWKWNRLIFPFLSLWEKNCSF